MAAAGAGATSDEEAAIERFKIQKLIKSLNNARGNGTSMISLILPPGSQIAQVNKMLGDEYGTASNIKSRVNRLSVLSAITSTQQRLKLYTRCPKNGLVMYCGEVMTEDGKQKKLNIDFEPFKPINTSLYLCDNKFHTEALSELLADDKSFGIIVMDGNGSLYGTVSGNHREILHKFSVELPKKHGRGGQSALRFARLRLEKRHNYVRKVGEFATTVFITADRPNIAGLVLAGSAEFKQQLERSDLLDPRLKQIVVARVDVSYGGENGFNQAVELSAEVLSETKYVSEKRLLSKYYDHIARDTGRYCFGVVDTMHALEMSAVETLIVWEDMPEIRYQLRNPSTGSESVVVLTAEKLEADRAKHLTDRETGADLEVVSSEPFVEWIAVHYKDYGASLEFITDRSQEGSQFVKGFGGVGGVLRWKVDFVVLGEYMEAGEEEAFDEDDFM